MGRRYRLRQWKHRDERCTEQLSLQIAERPTGSRTQPLIDDSETEITIMILTYKLQM